jgi:hypothetical protein
VRRLRLCWCLEGYELVSMFYSPARYQLGELSDIVARFSESEAWRSLGANQSGQRRSKFLSMDFQNIVLKITFLVDGQGPAPEPPRFSRHGSGVRCLLSIVIQLSLKLPSETDGGSGEVQPPKG